jgi:Plasma-membrane choline transporter
VSFVDPTQTFLSIDESSWNHGEEQPVQFRNIVFAILFLAQLVAVLTLSIMAIVAWSKDADFIISPFHIHWIWDHESTSTATSMLLFGITVLGCTAALSAIIILFLLTTFADMMIQVSLVLPPISCGLSSLGALMLGQIVPSLLLLLTCVMGIWYAKSVWHRIPFATANVAVAMAAIHAHKGVLGLAYATLAQAILWTVLWSLAVVEVSMLQNNRRCDGSNSSSHNQNEYDVVAENYNLDCTDSATVSTQEKWILLGLFLSLYWTSEVIRNVLHTTIAGVVGTFWFVGAPAIITTPAAGSPANNHHTTIFDSWLRSSVYSFGSICLGSLLVAVVQVLQLLVRLGRSQRQQQQQRRHQREQVFDASSMLWCLLECIVDYLERLLEYINSWAFGKSTDVGVFLDSMSSISSIFLQRS